MNHQPGDVVNGHRLNEDGTQWLPVDVSELPPPSGVGIAPSVAPSQHERPNYALGAGITVAVVGATGLGLLVVAMGAAQLVAPLDEAVDPAALADAAYTCGEVEADVVGLSQEEDMAKYGFAITHIDDQRAVYVDSEQSPVVPTGEEFVRVFECQGNAVWSDGDETPISFGIEFDAEGDEWFYYQEL